MSESATAVLSEETKTVKTKSKHFKLMCPTTLVVSEKNRQPAANQNVVTNSWHISSNGHLIHSVCSLASALFAVTCEWGNDFYSLHGGHIAWRAMTTPATGTHTPQHTHARTHAPVPWRRPGWRRWSRTRSRRHWRCWEPGSTWWQRWQYQTPPQALAFLLEDKVDVQVFSSYQHLTGMAVWLRSCHTYMITHLFWETTLHTPTEVFLGRRPTGWNDLCNVWTQKTTFWDIFRI